MKNKFIKLATALFFCAVGLQASVIEWEEVLWLCHYGFISSKTSFQTSYSKQESSIKVLQKKKFSSYSDNYKMEDILLMK